MSHKQQPVLRQRKSRSLDEGRETPPRNPIHGDFVSVSPSRGRSVSPRKRLNKQSVHINMNLTEYQMNRLADAFSNNGIPTQNLATAGSSEHPPVNSSPAKHSSGGNKDASAFSPWTPDPASQDPNAHGHSNGEPGDRGRNEKRNSVSTTFSDLMPRPPGKTYTTQTVPATLAEHRKQENSLHIQLDDARKYGTHVHRPAAAPAASPVAGPSHHMTSNAPILRPYADDVSSIYSQDGVSTTPRGSPVRLRGETMSQKLDDVLQYYGYTSDDADHENPASAAYSSAKVSSASPVRSASPIRDASPQRPRRHQDDGRGRVDTLTQQTDPPESASYSPLTTYFAFEGIPLRRINGKTMIGERGWLERPGVDDKNSEPHKRDQDSSPKKLGLLDSIKKMAKDVTESKAVRWPAERGHHHSSRRKIPKLIISLDPREQSLLYCELEFHATNAIHAYITNELNHGRLDANKLKKVADGWAQKGRPKVVGFRYDLETQLELVDLHLMDFRFFGHRQGNHVEISALLYTMKVNARAMRVRTFCQPDSVVAKQLVDSQSLFNTLGCSDTQQFALAEIAQFFKVIVERETHYREELGRQGEAGASRSQQEQQEEMAHPGRRWEPPPGAVPPEGAPEVYGSSTPSRSSREPGSARRDMYH